jgi:transcriptional antiterminator NusG
MDNEIDTNTELAPESEEILNSSVESIVEATEVDPSVSEDAVSSESLSENSEVVASSEVPVVEEGPSLEEIQAKLPWYVVHIHSGFEARVKLGLEERIRNAKLQTKFGRIIVPQEKVVELVKGEKKTSTRKFFPGYMLMQLELNDETWHLVKDTPKVTGFVGDMHNPVPLTPQEVQNLFQQMEGGAQRPRSKVQYEIGDSVKIVDGPFADFNGSVDDVKPDKGKLRVLISIFGRNTPVELDFVQVEKV